VVRHRGVPESRPLIRCHPESLSWPPEHWRFRAEEARTVADQVTHEEERTIMQRIATDYDRLAKLAEVQLFRWWHGI